VLNAENLFKICAYTNAARARETFAGNLDQVADASGFGEIAGIRKAIRYPRASRRGPRQARAESERAEHEGKVAVAGISVRGMRWRSRQGAGVPLRKRAELLRANIRLRGLSPGAPSPSVARGERSNA
jgi:hypothetical protein